MKILILAEMMDSDRASYRIRLRTAECLAERGHAVILVTPSSKSWAARDSKLNSNLRIVETLGIAPVSLRRGGFSVLDTLMKTWLAVREHYDVIHVTCGHRPALLLPALAGKFLMGSAIVDEWWEWYGKGGRADDRRGLMQIVIAWYDTLTEIPSKCLYDGIIAISSALRDRIPGHRRVIVLNGAVDAADLRPYDRMEARRALGLDDGLFIVGLPSVGEADHCDNAPFLRAMVSLKHSRPELRLFVTGDGPYIESLARNEGLGEILIGHAWLPYEKYNQYLCACDAFALPLRDIPRNQGRWPHKLGDYLLLERPVIATDVGDVGTLFRRYRLGLLCDGSSDGYEKALKQLMDDLDRRRLCQDATLVTREVLDLGHRVSFMEALYRDTVVARTSR